MDLSFSQKHTAISSEENASTEEQSNISYPFSARFVFRSNATTNPRPLFVNMAEAIRGGRGGVLELTILTTHVSDK